MAEISKPCPNCGARIAAEWTFCEQCGARAPAGPYGNAASQAGFSTAVVSSPRGKRGWVALGAAALMLCICSGAAVGAYMTKDRWMPSILGLVPGQEKQAEEAEIAVLPEAAATVTAIPSTTATESTIANPSEAPATPQPPPDTQVKKEPFVWADDFLSKNTGWETFDDPGGYASYHEGGVFAIAISEPDLELRSWRDLPSDVNTNDASISVSGFKVEGEGWWGIICRWMDDDNYYQLGIDGPAFTVLKTINGEETTLTNPEWIETNVLDPNGYDNGRIPVNMRCEGSTIEVKVDGMSVFKTQDNDLSKGDWMIYGSSFDIIGDVDGYYLKVLFDDFKISIP